MNNLFLVFAGAFILFSSLIYSCGWKSKNPQEMEISIRGKNVCSNYLMLDGHIDWPSRLMYHPSNINERNSIGDFDVVRAREGGLDAILSVVWVSPKLSVEEGRNMVDSQMNTVQDYIENFPELFATATNSNDLKNNYKNGLISLPLCLENGSPIGNDLSYLNYLKQQGFAYITLCHSESNQISDSSYDTLRPWNGLSPFAYEVINEMNRLGIIVDVSHSTDSATFQALKYSKAPVIASHSATRHYVPGFERNLSDTLIQLIAAKNGIIMVNFGSGFIDSTCKKNWESLWYLKDSIGISIFSPEGEKVAQEMHKTKLVYSNASRIADHIGHIVKIAGVNYVGLGSDFDGIGPSQPIDVPDVSGYPNVIAELMDRGYSPSDLEKIMSANFMRVWDETLVVSDSLSKI